MTKAEASLRSQAGRSRCFALAVVVSTGVLSIGVMCCAEQLAAQVGEERAPDALLRSMAARDPTYLTLVPVDRALLEGKTVRAVPPHVRDRGVKAVEMIVRESWLPKGLPARVNAVKDVELATFTDKEGRVISRVVADYLVAEYRMQGRAVSVQENGSSVSARLQVPPDLRLVEDNPRVFIRECLTMFLNVKPDVLDGPQFEFRLSKIDGLWYGMVGDLSKTDPSSDLNSPRWWWERMAVATDGKWFYVSVPEWAGTRHNPRAQPGLPDRF